MQSVVPPIELHSKSVSGKKTLGKPKMKAIIYISSIQEKLAKTLNVEQKAK